MTAEEVYTFSVVLCDNEVDRDFERFTIPALKELATLFLGKTGIFDHSAKTENQSARIYDTYLEESGRLTENGEPYTRLVAKAYLPKSEKNSQLILEIDSGMKKEVSVGCSMQKRVCSICGADRQGKGCDHQKGKRYTIHGMEKCAHDILSAPADAYEWSFVAVPSQRQAGVIKKFDRGGNGMAELQKLFDNGQTGDVLLTKEAIGQLRQHLAALEEQSKFGQRYRDVVASEVRKLSRVVQPEVPSAVMERIIGAVNLEDLESLQKSFRRRAETMLPMQPQLWREPSEQADDAGNKKFQI